MMGGACMHGHDIMKVLKRIIHCKQDGPLLTTSCLYVQPLLPLLSMQWL
jgi:hypothetical protein